MSKWSPVWALKSVDLLCGQHFILQLITIYSTLTNAFGPWVSMISWTRNLILQQILVISFLLGNGYLCKWLYVPLEKGRVNYYRIHLNVIAWSFFMRIHPLLQLVGTESELWLSVGVIAFSFLLIYYRMRVYVYIYLCICVCVCV